MQIYQNRKRSFLNQYQDYIEPRFNQLFRNQLIAAAILHDPNTMYDFVSTGLFCHHEDKSAIQIAKEFQNMLTNGKENFKIITYQEFIEAMQKMDLNWEQRELSMLLWARYCGIALSEQIWK